MREGGRKYVGDGESNGGIEEGTKVDELPKGTEQRWCEPKISSSRNNIFIPAEALSRVWTFVIIISILTGNRIVRQERRQIKIIYV